MAGGTGGDGGGRRHVRHRWRGLIEVAAACGGVPRQDDPDTMSPFWRKAVPTPTLTAAERDQLQRLEATVEAGAQAAMAMIEAGRALATIRDRELFRDTAASWETYVETRFRMSKRRADQVIAFAGVKAALDELGTTVPNLSERAARPLAGLPVDELKVVVAEASQDPAGVTAATIQKAAAKRKAKAKVRVPRPVRLKVAGGIVEIALNAKGVKAGVTIEAALVAALEAVRRQATEAA